MEDDGDGLLTLFRTEELPVHRRATAVCCRGESGRRLEQWVQFVTGVSSEYGDESEYGANQIVGPPRVYPANGDSENAWCHDENDDDGNLNHFIEVMFRELVELEEIHVYETYHAGGTVAISAQAEDGGAALWTELFRTDAPCLLTKSRIFSPKLKVPSGFVTRKVRVDISSAASNDDYVELDAIKLIGKRLPQEPNNAGAAVAEQWVTTVLEASSSWAGPGGGWHWDCLIGPPRQYPTHGDNVDVWCHADGHTRHHCTVEYEDYVRVDSVRVYETMNVGGVTRISVRDHLDDWIILWEADGPPTSMMHSRIFEPTLELPCRGVVSRVVRVDLDSSATDGDYIEIDAVQLIGKPVSVMGGRPSRIDLAGRGGALCDLAECMSQLLAEAGGSDVVLVAEGRAVPAHRALLAARCPHLAQLVQRAAPHPEARVEVAGVDAVTLRGMLQYVYTAQLHPQFTTRQLANIYKAAQTFAMIELAECCVDYLRVEMNIQDVIPIYNLCYSDKTLAGRGGALCDLAECMSQLLAEAGGSDVVLVAEGRAVPAHRALLAARCPHLAQLVQRAAPHPEASVEVAGVETVTLHGVLQYVCTAQLHPQFTTRPLANIY